ncbi:MAG: DNA primase [Gammaproteobacteria bacterium]|nr:DNA primase [Gammaproteobacteria bacterium]
MGIVSAAAWSLPALAGSWDAYIDNLIAQTQDASGTTHADKACIIGLDGGALWTSVAHPNALKLASGEGAAIAQAFKSKDFTPFMASGIVAEGVKYQFLREEDGNIVYGKKKDAGGITLQASKTAIVIATTPEGKQQGNTNKGVAVIADYLESLGR